ncbi:MAG: hypothetical protein HY320_13425 [Armatimonadetes bacterium]|nr:hypothetical protein [Armatimonadota bacterium]
MSATRFLIPAAGLALAIAAPGLARRGQAQAEMANQHLSAIVLLQRWAQAIYHFLPAQDGGCEPTFGEWVDNGDGTFTQVNQTADCTRIVNTSYGGQFDFYDQAITYSNGIREQLQVRPVERFNEAPGKVHFDHRFSTGDHVEYDQELQQETALDADGNPISGLNFWYALISRGSVRLASGQHLQFELRQTKSFDCYNFFNDSFLPEEVCDEWFVFNEELGVLVPRPDRLHVSLGDGTPVGTLDLAIPTADPFAGVPDFFQNVTGTFVLGNRTMDVLLIPNSPDDPDFPRWKFWQTSGRGYQGMFQLGVDFSGGGQAFDSRGRRRRLQFAARWNRSGIGTVILPNGQTRPGGPTSGALEFGNLKWSGLATAFGPTPGL